MRPPFGFLPQTFDVICSDLASLPVARAVAASNGFPVLFGPITLRNYREPEDINTNRFAAGLLPMRRILIISVDGQSAPNPNWPTSGWSAVSGK